MPSRTGCSPGQSVGLHGKVTAVDHNARTAFVVRFEVFTAVTVKNGVFSDIMTFRKNLAPLSSR
jgi:hypothetical protein